MSWQRDYWGGEIKPIVCDKCLSGLSGPASGQDKVCGNHNTAVTPRG